MNYEIKIAFGIVAFIRVIQICVDYNYDWPDQYWQGPQIAYKMANGYGFETWQWTLPEPLRCSIYQLYLAIGYYLGNVFNLSPLHKEYMVKLMQVILAIVSDWYLLKIAQRYTAKLTIMTSLLILTNWFYFSMMNRTYINSIETCLTVIAFYYWLARSQSKNNDLISRIIVALCFIVRTTSIILWAVVWPFELLRMKGNKIKFILKNLLQIVLMTLCSIVFNSLWFGKFAFVELNFFKYNIILKWSELYGVHSFFYYFYFAIPYILGGYIIPFLISCFSFLTKSSNPQIKNKAEDSPNGKLQLQKSKENERFRELFVIVIVTLFILSLSAHKQPRFLLIMTPLLLILSLKGLQKLENKTFFIIILVLINFSLFFGFALYGKTGGVKILRTLREDIDKNHPNNLSDIAIIYLCEPHSLPLYSLIQQNVRVRILDTSPPQKLKQFNENNELKDNAEALYNQLTEGLNEKHILYVIIQEKYSIFNSFFSQQYQFLLKNNFQLLKSQRNVNIWELRHLGWDGFALLKKS